MKQYFVLWLVSLTTVGGFLYGRRGLGLSAIHLRDALSKMLECAGMMLVFCVVNLAVGVVVILAVRTLMGRFLPLYLAGDATLPALSLLQGLAFQQWRWASGLPSRRSGTENHGGESPLCPPT